VDTKGAHEKNEAVRGTQGVMGIRAEEATGVESTDNEIEAKGTEKEKGAPGA